MMYKIKCIKMHHLYGVLPVPYVAVRVTLGDLVAHRYTYAPPRCRTLQYRRTFIPLSVYLRNDHTDPVFDSVGQAGTESGCETDSPSCKKNGGPAMGRALGE